VFGQASASGDASPGTAVAHAVAIASATGASGPGVPASGVFVGSLAGTGSASMTMTGSLLRGASGPVGEMGGQVLISGPNNYAGSGIFAGRAP